MAFGIYGESPFQLRRYESNGISAMVYYQWDDANLNEEALKIPNRDQFSQSGEFNLEHKLTQEGKIVIKGQAINVGRNYLGLTNAPLAAHIILGDPLAINLLYELTIKQIKELSPDQFDIERDIAYFSPKYNVPDEVMKAVKSPQGIGGFMTPKERLCRNALAKQSI